MPKAGQESTKKNTKKQVCSELEAAGRQESVHSVIKCVSHQHELRGLEQALNTTVTYYQQLQSNISIDLKLCFWTT